MYGFPDSAVVGTAKRIRRAVRGNDVPKDEKGRPVPEVYALDIIFEWLDAKIDAVIPTADKEELKLARQEYYERYGHYPAGDPR